MLRERPELAGDAVEEFLRFEAPVQLNLRRYAKADTEVGGVAVVAGEWLVPAVGAANHDGRVFDDPDRFDVTREPGQHLTFGRGIHFCIGAPLARLDPFRPSPPSWPGRSRDASRPDAPWSPDPDAEEGLTVWGPL